MSDKHLWAKPHNITEDKWWYEVRKGITVCVHVDALLDNNMGWTSKTILVDIPWRSIRSALGRKDKK